MLRGRLEDETVINMTYVEAFLFLTIDYNIPFVAVIDWLRFLSVEYPESRLACHHKRCHPAIERIHV